MFHKILIPLDGSPLAEKALPYAQHIGKSASLLLVRVLATSAFAPVDYTLPDEVRQADEDVCKTYLHKIRDRLAADGYTVDVETCTGEPAEAILHSAERNHADLILISSHGRTGVKRFVQGSVAERVARHAHCAVMIVGQGSHVPE